MIFKNIKSVTTGFTGALLMALCCAAPLILIALGLYNLSYIYALTQHRSMLWGVTIFFLLLAMWLKNRSCKIHSLKRIYFWIAFLIFTVIAGLLFVSYTGQPIIYPPNFLK